MNHHNTTIKYIQEGNYFNDEVNIEVSTIEGQSDIILLIVPGIDGSVDGYKNKYKTIAENINSRFGATVIRMSNLIWLDYILEIFLKSLSLLKILMTCRRKLSISWDIHSVLIWLALCR